MQSGRIGTPGEDSRSTRPRLRALFAALAVAFPAAAQPTSQTPPAQPDAPPDVPIERLFKLPDSVAAPSAEPRRGGKTRAEWLARFQQAQADLEAARKALDDARKQLEEVAPDAAWSVTAPGLPVDPQPTEKSIDFRLRQEIRRQREEVERAERRLDELGIEANLAEIPADWRAPTEPAPPEAGPER